MKEIERFVPGMQGPIWYEHWHRYHFVAPIAAGKAVVDVACGEGYGSAFLAKHAARVTGIDVSAETVALARRRYGAARNIEFLEGRCEALPVADASVDLLSASAGNSVSTRSSCKGCRPAAGRRRWR